MAESKKKKIYIYRCIHIYILYIDNKIILISNYLFVQFFLISKDIDTIAEILTNIFLLYNAKEIEESWK